MRQEATDSQAPKRKALPYAGLLLALLVAACAPATPGTADGERQGPGSSAPKTLTIALEGEPENLIISLGGGAGSIAGNLRLAVHQHLATYDDRGALHPMLATALPSQADGTWVVRPDGSMQTTYRLRPNITWHDGTPLTARDFVFGWTVNRDPELPISSPLVARQVGRIDTPDDHTLVLEWTRTYPFANAITNDELGPLPVHLIESVYLADKDRFQQLPYWKREFVGVGPYQVVEWEPGSHLTLRAYDGFYAGRARIDTLIFRFIPNAPTAVANVLAGSVDGAIPRAIDFSQSMFVKSEWERAGRKPVVIVQPTHWRMMGVQFRVPQVRDILDVRVRRGLLHGIDRQGLVETLLDGQAPISHTFIPPDDVKWDWVQDAVARYDHDPRRAQEVLAAAGWRRGVDGLYLNAAGERITIPIWTTSGEQNEQELAIISDNWKAIGVNVEQVVLPSAQTRNNELRASFPSFDTTAIPVTFENTTQRVYGPTCPSEGSRWAGGNRGCYVNPEMDRLIDTLTTTIDPADQRRIYRDVVKLQTEDLPVLPLYFNVQVTVFREGVLGVKGDTKPRTSVTWNVAEWDIR